MRSFFIGLIAVLCSVINALAYPYVIDMGTAAIDPSSYLLSDAGVSYQPQKNGYYNRPLIEKSHNPPGLPAWIDISAPKSISAVNPDGTDTDRIEYIVCSEHDAHCPKFDGIPHTESGWIYIDPGSNPPTLHPVVLFQWWQGTGVDKDSPPVYLYLQGPRERGDAWPLSLCLKNDTTGYTAANAPIVIWKGGIFPGTWHYVRLTVIPSYTGGGSAVISFDGVQVGAYRGSIGYKPGSLGGASGASGVFRVKFGLYRKCDSPSMAFGFSQISYY